MEVKHYVFSVLYSQNIKQLNRNTSLILGFECKLKTKIRMKEWMCFHFRILLHIMNCVSYSRKNTIANQENNKTRAKEKRYIKDGH